MVECDYHDLPLIDGWHYLTDPEGIEGTQKIPCSISAMTDHEEPTTEAGRRLLHDFFDDGAMPIDPGAAILEIERQARATAPAGLDRETLTRAMRVAFPNHEGDPQSDRVINDWVERIFSIALAADSEPER